jgi:DedD protein
MTQRESGQDFDPKHRIVGAIIVVALAVIFIPMILSDRESSADRPDAQAIAPDNSPDEPNKVAVTILTPSAATTNTAKNAPVETTSADNVKAAKQTEESESKAPASKPLSVPAASHAAETKPPSSGWVVQVGTFSNTSNATRLEKKLRAKGQPVLTEKVNVSGSSAVRLRVGPFRDRASALEARERINRDVGVKGVVLAYP